MDRAKPESVPAEVRLQQLAEAEEQVCKILQLSTATCQELEQLPFSDPAKLQQLSAEFLESLKIVRQSIISNVDVIGPTQAEAPGESARQEEVQKALSALDDLK
jgi:hypothetical protein